jgi:hypothetical protein
MSWTLSIGDETPVDGHTYNLTPMWRLAGVVEYSTKELDERPVAQLAVRAREGLVRAVELKPAFVALTPSNGWGDYDDFVEVLFGLWRAAASADRMLTARWSG